MNKGIIVVDMPEMCGECICCDSNPIEDICRAADKITKYVNSPPEWCPIDSLPEKDNSDISGYYLDEYPQGFKNGWNACIDKILGGAADE